MYKGSVEKSFTILTIPENNIEMKGKRSEGGRLLFRPLPSSPEEARDHLLSDNLFIYSVYLMTKNDKN